MSLDKLFHIIEDSFAIIRCKGVWKQVKLFHKNGKLFAQYGNGFIKLYKYGTSRPDIFVEDLITPYSVDTGKLDELIIDINKLNNAGS